MTVEHVVGQCPHCRGGNYTGGSWDTDSVHVWQKLTCHDCGCTWDETFSFSGIDSIERPPTPPSNKRRFAIRVWGEETCTFTRDLTVEADDAASALAQVEQMIAADLDEEEAGIVDCSDDHKYEVETCTYKGVITDVAVTELKG